MSSVTSPREGLPPCMSLVIFDGRGASLVDNEAGCHSPLGAKRFRIGAGSIGPRRVTTHRVHPGFLSWPMQKWVLSLDTDDPDEAAAAFERGREYVRTGQLGEAT